MCSRQAARHILEFAQANAQRAGLLSIQTEVADAQRLDLHRASFDAAVCRLGLMFCQNPIAAVHAVHNSLKLSAPIEYGPTLPIRRP